MGDRVTGAQLVPASHDGPFSRFVGLVRTLGNNGQYREALAAADLYEVIAAAFGDYSTVDKLIQRRMYVYMESGEYDPGLAVGAQLAARRRAAGDVPGEAKTLANMADMCIRSGRVTDGMRYLARAGLLLESTARRDRAYMVALSSYAEAATAAGLIEVAAAAYEERYAGLGSDDRGYVECAYGDLLASWGLWLEHIGHLFEAGHRWRRLATITDAWLGTFTDTATFRDVQTITGIHALALAKLGHIDQAEALIRPMTAQRCVDPPPWEEFWTGHLAYAVVLRARGDHATARRELLAAEQLAGSSGHTCGFEDRLLVRRELALLNTETLGADQCTDLLDALRREAVHLWQQRRQRLAMLQQGRHREHLETERAHTEAAMLRDPLTGLGNRRHFDQLMADLDAGAVDPPLAVLVIDVDKFKTINDTHSHSTGDQVLRTIGQAIAAHCRAGIDIPIRYAGDEFAIFLATDLVGAVDVAERMRAAVAGTDFDHLTPGTPVSISTGVAALRAGMSGAELFHAADTNLYQAKRAGRNRVAG